MFHSRRNREYWNACKEVQTEGYIIDIQRFPLSSPHFRRQVGNFLAANGLRLESVDDYFCITGNDGSIIAGAGLYKDIIKCIAVDPSARSLGLLGPLVSHVISFAGSKGINNLKVFTKPENEAIFVSLGFHVLARAPKAILMENGRGLEEYLRSLSDGCPATAGVIVMNANPFTLGHRHLVRKAAEIVDRLYVIPVKEDVSLFPYVERLEMIRKGCEGVATVLEGSDYQISAATFPTYFLKDLSDASETQMRLDIVLFGRHIAPALGVTVRFVGSEPSDLLTARYNELMKEILPEYGIQVVEIPRLAVPAIAELVEAVEEPVSASIVRNALAEGSFMKAASLTPPSTWPYLAAELISRALKMELEAPLKPGLVDRESNGSHSDMDYNLMLGSIDVIRRSFVRHLPLMETEDIVSFGKAIEADVLEYTNGVNTYRGAIFALGLASVAAIVDREGISTKIAGLAGLVEVGKDSHGGKAVEEYGVKGALQMAREGYKPLFEDWLPYFRSLEGDGMRLQKTLLRIMSTLDDTCVIHRAGYQRAQEVKREASGLLDNFSLDGLKEMTASYDAQGISPGGAADMLALTILIDSLTN